MCKEANFSLAVFPIFACLCSVPCRVEPALKNAVSELAAVATATPSTAILRAHRPGVVVPPRVAATGLFARVGKGAVGPVVAPAAGAPSDLELVHPEVVGGVRVVGVRVGVVVGEELVQDGLVGEQVAGAVVCGGDGAAGEELPRWDVDFS